MILKCIFVRKFKPSCGLDVYCRVRDICDSTENYMTRLDLSLISPSGSWSTDHLSSSSSVFRCGFYLSSVVPEAVPLLR